MLAGLGYVENWWLIHTNQAYGAIFSEGSPVQHFWSLAIEEQYYLFFPLLMVVLFRVFVRNLRITVALAVLTAASFLYAALAELESRPRLLQHLQPGVGDPHRHRRRLPRRAPRP